MNKYKKIEAFSLIELLVVIAVFGILASTGGPMMSAFIEQRQGNNAYKLLANNIDSARSAARDSTSIYSQILIIPNDPSADPDWMKGWKVRAQTSDGKILSDQPAFDSTSFKMTSDQFTASNPITFNRRGYLSQVGSLVLTPNKCGSSSHTYTITLARSGLSNTSKSACTSTP